MPVKAHLTDWLNMLGLRDKVMHKTQLQQKIQKLGVAGGAHCLRGFSIPAYIVGNETMLCMLQF